MGQYYGYGRAFSRLREGGVPISPTEIPSSRHRKMPSRHVWQHPLPAAMRMGNGGKCAFATWQNFEMQNT